MGGGVGFRNTPSRFMLQNRDKLRPDEPLGSYADFAVFIKTIHDLS